MNDWFNRFATKVSSITGHSYAFAAAALIIIVWLLTGPLLGFSDTWQLLINTLTTLVTFLMVFVIQNGQNRATNAMHIKLDFILELLGVDDDYTRKLETMSDKELDELLKKVQEGREKANGQSSKTRSKG